MPLTLHAARADAYRGRPSSSTSTCAAITLCAGLLATTIAAEGSDLGSLDLQVTDADLAPAITLREDHNRVTEEYRINGQLYMVKITPNAGAPYYLVDEDGSGDMSMHRGGDDLDIAVPKWVLLSW